MSEYNGSQVHRDLAQCEETLESEGRAIIEDAGDFYTAVTFAIPVNVYGSVSFVEGKADDPNDSASWWVTIGLGNYSGIVRDVTFFLDDPKRRTAFATVLRELADKLIANEPTDSLIDTPADYD